jgi:hypothetical protein
MLYLNGDSEKLYRRHICLPGSLERELYVYTPTIVC